MDSEDTDDLPDIPRYPPEPEEDHHEPDDPGPQEDEDLGPQHDEQLPAEGDQGERQINRTSRSRSKMSEEEKREKRRMKAAEKRANETPEQRRARNSVQNAAKKARNANETPELTQTRQAQAAAQKRKKRANETPAQRQARQAQDAALKSNVRANETPAQRQARQAQHAAHAANVRANETPAQRQARQIQHAAHMVEVRANETPAQRQARQAQHAAHMVEVRANETQEQADIRNDQNRTRNLNRRNAQKTSVAYKDAMKTQEILNGTFEVEPLNRTDDDIGPMTFECPNCHALKFDRETPSSCCQGGKVELNPYPKPPQKLQEMWLGQDEKSVVLRKFSRTLNNALCLASLENHAPVQSGWQPSAIFQGQVSTRAGPLLPGDGEQPLYSQLYVLDPSLESTTRYSNMVIPSNTSVQEKVVLREVLDDLQQVIHDVNPFVQDYRQIVEMINENIVDGTIVISAKAPRGEHSRRYNRPTNLQEVSIVTDCQPHDLILQKRGGGLRKIHDMNPKGMPLRFVLLFPYGTYGWDETKKHADGRRRVTPREYYVFHMNVRNQENQNFLHLAGRLFQEWLCWAWFLIENQRLHYQRLNQKALRADTYQNVRDVTQQRLQELGPRTDGLYGDDHQQPRIGRMILASSFTGSPRWYNKYFQDAMAIVRKFHKPDFFVTMTTNPNWPEITEQLLPGQKPHDRPDIVARVFHLKKDQLMKDLKVGGLFGEVVADMHVIEWQKRGLPHAHILLILANHDRAVTSELVDSLVTAELPPDPNEAENEQGKQSRQRLEDIVLSNMVHGPCGATNPNSPCMENGKCTKSFPKDFVRQTVVDPDSFYATYRRRAPEDGGRTLQKAGKIIDNSMIIPYNPHLSLRYECHINVECCTSPKVAKYVYKYCYKGNDRARVAARIEGEPIDEISDYQDLRSVSSGEAAWHIMAFEITRRHPSVIALRIHLKDQQQVVFDEDTEIEALENCRNTELTAYFEFNQTVEEAERENQPKYADMPETHIYDKAKKEWRVRKQDRGLVIGRIHSVNPVVGDLYYLRMLMHDDHCRGKISFEDMLKVGDQTFETYKEVCCQLGLLQDDREWQRVFDEAAATRMCPQIRELFVIVLMFCMPTDPRALYDEFWVTWADDFESQAWRRQIELTETQKQTLVLLDIDLRLQSFEKGLGDFGLPVPTQEELVQVNHLVSTEPAVIREEMDYDIEQLQTVVNERLPNFTEEQHEIYQMVLNAVNNGTELLTFIDARGGCGKTYLLNTILSAVRGIDGGSTALAMATTGIAAQLLTLGRTFHSRMKAPLTPTPDSTLQISAQSALARLVRTSKLLMIDEATMLDRYLLEALNRTLKDLMGNERPFGGKIVVLAGDFRQCLPVVQGASRGEIVNHCINQSALWQFFQVKKLSVNMRVRAMGDTNLQMFDDWSLSIGNGDMENLTVPEEMIACEILPNTRENRNAEGQAMERFCEEIFPNIPVNVGDPNWLEGRAILAVTNKEVNMINEVLAAKLPGNIDLLKSADELVNNEDLLRFNTEYLHTLCPNGFPPHDLRLKTNMPVMLLRNLNPREGLCNGTKMIYIRCIDSKLLECKIVGSQRTVLIPRITFIPKAGEFPMDWHRRQFPVRAAFATTINKSQGQTMKKAGIWLRTQVFTHGQLYVACSRVGNPENLKFALMKSEENKCEKAKNVVYNEVLL